jgi:CheY-like chemotaxis protein
MNSYNPFICQPTSRSHHSHKPRGVGITPERAEALEWILMHGKGQRFVWKPGEIREETAKVPAQAKEKEKVLIVADRSGVGGVARTDLKALLEKKGWEPHVAGWEEALEKLSDAARNGRKFKTVVLIRDEGWTDIDKFILRAIKDGLAEEMRVYDVKQSGLVKAVMDEFAPCGKQAKANSRGGKKAAKPMNILVFDEYAGNAESITEILRGKGHDVVVAACWNEAARAMINNNIDLLIVSADNKSMGIDTVVDAASQLVGSIVVTAIEPEKIRCEVQYRVKQGKILLLEKPFDLDGGKNSLLGAVEWAESRVK